jgi:hypothetical protein
MLERSSAALHRAASGSLSGQAANVMQSTVEEELAKCVAAHTHAQFERHASTHRHELELRAIMVVEQACHRVLSTLAANVGPEGQTPATAGVLEAASARFARASAAISGTPLVGAPATLPARGPDQPAWLEELACACALLDRLPSIFTELDAHPEGEPVRLGVA